MSPTTLSPSLIIRRKFNKSSESSGITAIEFSSIKKESLKILSRCKGKVLLIDDNYKKGWFSIFKSLFKNSNDLQLDNLEINFRTLNRDQIVEATYNKVICENTGSINYDVLILDFRLHSSDNNELNIDLISGMQILKKLKKFNPGIQVIIFSATNKTWNLQALQNAGADGFIIKESTNNNYETGFTKQSIEKMLQSINDCLENIFLKDFYTQYEKLSAELIPVLLTTRSSGRRILFSSTYDIMSDKNLSP